MCKLPEVKLLVRDRLYFTPGGGGGKLVGLGEGPKQNSALKGGHHRKNLPIFEGVMEKN